MERCTLIEGAFFDEKVDNTKDAKYNYARVLCHYGTLLMEFLDSWGADDGDRDFRCWRLFLPHFHASGTPYKPCVPVGTSDHSTYSDEKDIEKVITTVIENDLLSVSAVRRTYNLLKNSFQPPE